MTPERHREIGKLYHEAVQLEPDCRATFLDQACAGDEDLRQEVESLLALNEQAESFIESPALEVAARAMAADQAGSLVGRKVDRYQILSWLGRGGMGEVCLAHDPRLGRKVAIKLLPAEFTADTERLRRFEHEARAASALNHPNILTIHEFGEVAHRHFIVSELVEGQTLREQMTSGRMELRAVLEVAIQVASALEAAHKAGIVHRDIKPENVMVRPDGLLKVLDFGLAKLGPDVESRISTLARVSTETGVVMGTAGYMSPEQARGQNVDARSDIFSFGVMLYEMIAGRPPFEGATPSDVIAAILKTEPPPLGDCSLEARPELERIVSKALRKDLEQRYQVVGDLLLDLKDLKQELEWEAKQARVHQTDAYAETAGVTHQPVKKLIPQVDVARVGESSVRSATSSTKYLINFLRQRKRAAILILGAIIAAAAWSSYSHRAPVITEKDTLLLADFVNTTGDAVFDGTLKQALAVQLEQTPYLNLFAEERVREMLQYMGRSPDELVTKEVAREICQRQGIKAMIVGSIASLGRNYAITLETTTVPTGEVIARRQVEAEGKEQVLRALGRAATELREKLGESLASIQKFDAPIYQATTSSLEALRAYSLGLEVEHRKGKFIEAIPFYKRAIELDNNFALAYTRLAAMYGNTNQSGWMQYLEKAFELRDRVSERERLQISAFYYKNVAGELDKALAVTELLSRTYPRHPDAHYLLGNWYRDTGLYEKALEPYREASRLDPTWRLAYRNVGLALIRLDRFDEAKEVIERAMTQRLDDTGYRTGYHTQLYQIAFVRGDKAAMKQQLDWAGGKPEEYELIDLQAQAVAYAGQQSQARELSERAAELAEARNLKGPVAGISVENALRSAIFGLCLPAKEDAARALAHSWREGATGLPVRPKAALALALCGDVNQGRSLANDIALKYSQATLSHAVWVPMIRAAVELRHKNADKAIQLLQPASQYEAIGEFWPTYLRGQAYLLLEKGAEAAVEFQRILDHRGWNPLSPLYPLAYLSLARASALAGDAAKSRKGYQDFFELWKDADPDLPILVQAKLEYGRLR